MNFFHKNGKLKGQLTFISNKLNGDFLSYYENGNLKAKGSFLNNQRIGVWEVFDTSGQKKIVRNYTNNRRFNTTHKSNKPSHENDKLSYVDLTNNDSVYTLDEQNIFLPENLF